MSITLPYAEAILVSKVVGHSHASLLRQAMKRATQASVVDGELTTIFDPIPGNSPNDPLRAAAAAGFPAWARMVCSDYLAGGTASPDELRHHLLTTGTRLVETASATVEDAWSLIRRTACQALRGRTPSAALPLIPLCEHVRLADFAPLYREDVISCVLDLSRMEGWDGPTRTEIGALFYPSTPAEVSLRDRFAVAYRTVERLCAMDLTDDYGASPWRPLNMYGTGPGATTPSDLRLAIQSRPSVEDRQNLLAPVWTITRGTGGGVDDGPVSCRWPGWWLMREVMRLAQHASAMKRLTDYLDREYVAGRRLAPDAVQAPASEHEARTRPHVRQVHRDVVLLEQAVEALEWSINPTLRLDRARRVSPKL